MNYNSAQSLRGYDKAALGSITPTLSGVVVSDPRLPHEMKGESNDNSDSKLIVTYNVEDASEPTQLYTYMVQEGAPFSIRGVDMFDKVEIDGTEVSVSSLDTNWGGYQLSVGEHTIAYTLKDPTTIANNAFYGSNSIVNVEIPNSVTSINSRAFQICSSLTSITIPNSVTSIGDKAFDGCENITSVEIDSNTIVSATYTHKDNLKNIFGTQVTEYIIGNSVTSIGINAFAGCPSLTSVTIGSGVTSIGDGAFCACISLDAASTAAIEAINPNATLCNL